MSQQSLIRRLTVIGIAMVVIFGFSACGSDDDEDTDDTSVSSEENETDEGDSSDEDDTTEGEAPDWARGVSTPGDKIASMDLDDVTVDIYQVDVVEATDDSRLADPDTKEPLVEEGDDIVYVNYVVTNEGDAVDLGSSLVKMAAKYDDWEYSQSMEGTSDRDQFEEMDVFERGLDETQDPAIYTLDEGESYSFGVNFLYKEGTDITFEGTMAPVDDDGDRISDELAEDKVDATID